MHTRLVLVLMTSIVSIFLLKWFQLAEYGSKEPQLISPRNPLIAFAIRSMEKN